MCYPRISKGLLPGCVESCPTEALTYGKRKDLLRIARERIRRFPNRYVDHIYGEQEMGGTSWLYISAVPFNAVGQREDLGITPAPKLTSGALSAVPIVVGLWPVLQTGVKAMSKRKEKIADQEQSEAVNAAVEQIQAEAEVKLAETREAAEKDKVAAVEKAVNQALEEAAAQQTEEDADSQTEDTEKKPSKEES